MAITSEIPTAIFALKDTEIAGNALKLLPDKQALVTKLGDRGINAVFSAQAESGYDRKGAYAHTLETETKTKPLGHMAIERVGVIINLLDRSFKDDRLPQEWRTGHIPRINENAMRSLAFRKADMQTRVLDQLGLGMPTLLVESADGVASFTEQYPAEGYVIKPNSGTFSNGVRFMTARELADAPLDDLVAKPTIIQPKHDFTVPFAADVRPYDMTSSEAFEGWSRSDAVKEIRSYAFLGPSGVTTFPVARAMQDGIDHWFFVDPESLPENIATDTANIATRAAQETGSRGLMLAADFGYGYSPTGELHHTVVEVNGKMPYLIGPDKHAGVANVLRDKYADILTDIIRK